MDDSDYFVTKGGNVFGHNVPVGGGMTASGYIGNIHSDRELIDKSPLDSNQEIREKLKEDFNDRMQS